MNNFTKSSTLERTKMESLFEKFNVINYSFTDEDSYEQHDGIFTNSRNEDIIFEVKVRNVPSNRYSTTVIEESKYNYLMNQKDKVPFIFIFFSDGTYFPHKLEEVNNYKRTVMSAPKTTAGDQTKILKHFVEIPIKINQIYKQK